LRRSENSVKGFIAWLKANPDRATFGTNGMGGTAHIFGLLFQAITGTRFQFVPYRGLGPAMQDLVAGQIDAIIGGVADSIPQIRAGTIKGYAVTGQNRLPAAPDIPTADEAGAPGFYTANWRGLFGPKNTPKDVVAKLSAAARALGARVPVFDKVSWSDIAPPLIVWWLVRVRPAPPRILSATFRPGPSRRLGIKAISGASPRRRHRPQTAQQQFKSFALPLAV